MPCDLYVNSISGAVTGTMKGDIQVLFLLVGGAAYSLGMTAATGRDAVDLYMRRVPLDPIDDSLVLNHEHKIMDVE
jgi:TRAP-type mannitol/chloroaromatic compound transport system permease large subunit